MSIAHPNHITLVIIWTDNTQEQGTSGQSSVQDSNVTPSKQHNSTEASDAEVVRRAREEGLVSVVFPGTATQEGCCCFISEILKCILYQRQQLLMTYVLAEEPASLNAGKIKIFKLHIICS